MITRWSHCRSGIGGPPKVRKIVAHPSAVCIEKIVVHPSGLQARARRIVKCAREVRSEARGLHARSMEVLVNLETELGGGSKHFQKRHLRAAGYQNHLKSTPHHYDLSIIVRTSRAVQRRKIHTGVLRGDTRRPLKTLLEMRNAHDGASHISLS